MNRRTSRIRHRRRSRSSARSGGPATATGGSSADVMDTSGARNRPAAGILAVVVAKDAEEERVEDRLHAQRDERRSEDEPTCVAADQRPEVAAQPVPRDDAIDDDADERDHGSQQQDTLEGQRPDRGVEEP